MSGDILAAAAAVGLFVVILVVILLATKKKRKPLNVQKFTERWQNAQKHCGNKNTWPLAIIDADKVLDDALKARKYHGKAMGERLMAAQHDLTSNDTVWAAHKLRNRIVHEENVKLTQKSVKEALLGYRQALRDLGALESHD